MCAARCRREGVILGAVLALLMLPAVVTAAATTARTTRVVVFHPWGVRGHRLHGSCWTSSLVAWRPDAWRCLTGNQILDPCFSASPRVRSVICQVLPPLTGRGLRLDLTGPLPLGQQGRWPRVPHAWLIRVRKSVTCAYFPSMPPPMANPHTQPPRYGCSDGTFLRAVRPGLRWRGTRLWLRDTPRGYVVLRSRLVFLPAVWE